MQKLSNETALEHLDTLMGKVSISKEAAALEDAEKNGAIPGTPAGTETIPVKKDNDPENKEEIKNPDEGAFAAEKHQDLKDSTGGVEVEEMTPNANGRPNPVSTDFGAGPIDKESGEMNMKEQERIERLGAAILEKSAAQAPVAQAPVAQAPVELDKQAAEQLAAFEKLSAEDQEAVVAFRTAADAHYADYVNSFAAGMRKKAEDTDAVMKAQGMDEPTASAVLDDVASENPELVIPADDATAGAPAAKEGGDAGLENMSPEDIAMLEELANELEAAGVTPEELVQLAGEVQQEDADKMPEKVASERRETLKNIIRNIRG